ncbi:MAG: radical SAM protein [Gemmatimonadota bacterium]
MNLVAQDLAHYGREWRDGTDIATLASRLIDETAIPWFRLLYIYSAGLRDPLIELMASESRLLPYIDMPIQHASDPVLQRMRRPERSDSLRAKIRRLRDAIPDLTLRTTVLVGFPGETDDDFRALLDFLEEAAFEHLGAFAFSPQDGTRAAGMEEYFVPEGLARDRLEEVLEVQRAISADRLEREVGRRREVIVDREAEGRLTGRTRGQADDVDGVTYLSTDTNWSPGTLVAADIVSAHDYDLEADVVELIRAAPDPLDVSTDRHRPATTRRLPLAPLGLDSGFGR